MAKQKTLVTRYSSSSLSWSNDHSVCYYGVRTFFLRPQVSFNTSSVVSAAKGKVRVKKDNNNYAADIEVSNLAEPKRLARPKNMYVVWMETQRNGLQNLEQQNTASSLFAKNLKASLKTVTPYKPVRIFITG